GLFVSMPSKKRKNGTFRDIAHPLNNETRRHFEEQIIAKYREIVAETGGDVPAPLRRLESREDTDVDGGGSARADESSADGEPSLP
ncbi:MAG: SpoVG family protein, partial [Deltaproteobacteria bacterium]|nr:SpoVG family protein [Deltaproteobacteria bacterium]